MKEGRSEGGRNPFGVTAQKIKRSTRRRRRLQATNCTPPPCAPSLPPATTAVVPLTAEVVNKCAVMYDICPLPTCLPASLPDGLGRVRARQGGVPSCPPTLPTFIRILYLPPSASARPSALQGCNAKCRVTHPTSGKIIHVKFFVNVIRVRRNSRNSSLHACLPACLPAI